MAAPVRTASPRRRPALLSASAPEGRSRAGVVIDALALGDLAANIGIEVSGVASDTVRTLVVPRAGFAETVVEVNADTVRLTFLSPHRLRAVRAIDRPSAPASIQAVTPSRALHSRLGDVVAGLGAPDTSAIEVAPGDTLDLTFEGGALSGDQVRDYVLVARGRATLSDRGAGAMSSRVATAAPRAFRLLQNAPNPFRDQTAIGFDLPQLAEARLEIFDLAGRRVRTIRTGPLAPGSHVVRWDRRDRRGRQVAAGVYVYRLEAGPFRDRRRMVLVP